MFKLVKKGLFLSFSLSATPAIVACAQAADVSNFDNSLRASSDKLMEGDASINGGDYILIVGSYSDPRYLDLMYGTNNLANLNASNGPLGRIFNKSDPSIKSNIPVFLKERTSQTELLDTDGFWNFLPASQKDYKTTILIFLNKKLASGFDAK
jgi:hypothetical protein